MKMRKFIWKIFYLHILSACLWFCCWNWLFPVCRTRYGCILLCLYSNIKCQKLFSACPRKNKLIGEREWKEEKNLDGISNTLDAITSSCYECFRLISCSSIMNIAIWCGVRNANKITVFIPNGIVMGKNMPRHTSKRYNYRWKWYAKCSVPRFIHHGKEVCFKHRTKASLNDIRYTSRTYATNKCYFNSFQWQFPSSHILHSSRTLNPALFSHSRRARIHTHILLHKMKWNEIK